MKILARLLFACFLMCGAGAQAGTATVVTLGSGFSFPSGVALDSSGNLFVGDTGSNTVKEVLKSGGYSTVNALPTPANEFSSPTGVAVDSSGNVFVADYANSLVKEILKSGGYTTVNTLATANGHFTDAPQLGLDSSGNVFVADYINNQVKEILASGGYVTVNSLASGNFTNPGDVKVDSSGNVFVIDNNNNPDNSLNNNEVKEILAAGGYTTVVTLATGYTGFNYPQNLALDANGNVFVADSSNNLVKEILKSGGYTTVITVPTAAGTFNTPEGLVVDSSGNIFVADYTNNAVKEIVAGWTVTSLTSSPNPSTSTQSVTFTATVNSTSTVSEGTVTFTSDSSTISGCSAQPVSNGQATCTTTLGAGSHAIVASFNGDSTFLASDSPTLTQTVTAAVTATQAIASKALTQNHSATSFTPVTGGGGTAPLSYSISPGLPTGLSLSTTTGAITGTGSVTSSATTYTVTVTDADSATASNTFSLTVNSAVTATQSVASKALTQNHAATSFTPVTGGGGTGTLAYGISPSLPTGLSFNTATGAITGTASVTSSATTYTVTVTDANSATAANSFSLTVNGAVTATQAIPAAILTQSHAATSFTPITGGGGTTPLAYGISPTLPIGLSFSTATGAITGTASVTSSATTYTVTVTDANSATAANSFSLTVNGAVTATQAIPTVVFTQNHGATSFVPVTGGGGATPLAYSVSPSLPTGLSMASATGAITGTPTAVSSATSYTVTVTDANSATATASFSLTVNSAVTATQAIATTGLTQNHAATSFTPVTGSGGTGTLAFSLSPSLPTGLSFDTTTGAVSGTPSVISSATSYAVTVTDANNATATASFSLTVNGPVTATQSIVAEVLTRNHAAAGFTPVTGGGGTPALAYSIAPSLPTGLSFDTTTGAITGNPSVTSSLASYTVTVTDANSATATNTFSLTVSSAVTATQAVASTVLTQNHAATGFTPVTGGGGTGTLSYGVSPALPAGLSLSSATGAVTGTPSATLAAASFTVTVTDTNGATATAGFSLTVNTVPTATQAVSAAFLTKNFTVTPFTPIQGGGGTTPLAYSISPALPSGLSISASTGAVSGTPSAVATAASYTVTVTDANGATVTNSFNLTVNGPVTAAQAIASTSLTINHAATLFTPVTGAGGTGTLSYSLSPTLPPGLAMSSSTGQISGLPTATSTAASYMVTVTDANTATATASFSLAVNGAVTATQAIASTNLTQNHAAAAFTPVTGGGGTTPLSYSVSPALPAGLSMASATGAVTGTATVTSATTSYTVTVTDANGATATAGFGLTVNPAVTATQAVASTSLKVNQVATAFSPVTGGGGTGALSYSIAPGLPSGLSLAPTTGTIGGTPTVTLAATGYTVTVTDANNATATAGFSLGITTTASSVAVTTSADPSNYGQPVTFTAAVSGAGATPTGTAIFKDGAKTLFTGTLAKGLSSYTSSTLSPGTHAITVTYSGDSIFAGSSGGFSQLVGGAATTPGQTYPYKGSVPGFVGPAEAVWDYTNDHLLVANAGADSVQVLSAQTLAVVATLGTPGVAGSDTAHFNDPTGVTFDATTDQIFVSDTGNDRVEVFNAVTFAYVGTIGISSSGVKLAAAGNASFNTPGGILADAATGRLYVADTGNQRVQIFDTATMANVATLGTAGLVGSDNAHFNAPKGVAVDTAVNEILVADSANNRVQRFDATSFAYKGTIGGAGLSVGNSDYLGSPSAIAYDALSNLVLVADSAEQRVEVFDALSYNYVLTLGTTGSAGSGNGQFSGPAGVAIDTTHQRVFIGDQLNNRVQIFSIEPTVAFASVLPGSRSVELGQPATIFASMINAGATALQGCAPALPVTAPAGLTMSYQTTNPATNALTGAQDTPATIAANNGLQSFLVTFQGAESFSAPGMALDFGCLGIGPAAVETGVDTVDLAMSTAPVADVIALAATASNNGIIELPVGGYGAFAVASSNVGATSQIVVSVDTGSASLPLTATLCQSNPSTGACLATPATSVTLSDPAGAAPTFSVFLEATGTIPFAPATSRIFVRFKDPAGGLHGSTSVAVETE